MNGVDRGGGREPLAGNPKEGDIMSRTGRILAVLVGLAVAMGAGPLAAQRGSPGGGLGLYGYGPRLGDNVQLALEHQEELGLSEEQVATLRNLQQGIQRDVAPLQTEIDDLRAHIIAGEVSRVDGLLTLEQLLADFQEAAAPYRTGITTVLTADQHARLQEIVWGTRPWTSIGAWAYGGSGLGLGVRAYGGWGLGLGMRAYGGQPLGRGVGIRGGRVLGWGTRASYGRGLGRGIGVGRGWRWD
jgi:hypothetical protein